MNQPLGVGISINRGPFQELKAEAARKTKLVVTGYEIHPINQKNHEQRADYRIIDNQHSRSYVTYFWESKPEPLEHAEADGLH